MMTEWIPVALALVTGFAALGGALAYGFKLVVKALVSQLEETGPALRALAQNLAALTAEIQEDRRRADIRHEELCQYIASANLRKKM